LAYQNVVQQLALFWRESSATRALFYSRNELTEGSFPVSLRKRLQHDQERLIHGSA
jgi:hypothetical protein